MAGMDKELLKKYRLEEAQKRFQQISEYTFITKPLLDEEGDDDQQQPQDINNQPVGQQQPPQQDNGGNPGGDVQPKDDMNGVGKQTPVSGDDMPPQQGDSAGVPDNGGEQMGVDFETNDSQTVDDNVSSMQDGDEVIDVDELTNAQETTEVKIDGVNDKLQDLLAVTTKFIAAVDQNNKKIDDLRAEFEKRNPSEEERINIRSQASAPYSETPKDYWDKKSQASNYNVIYNNDVDPDKEENEYIIKKGDINGIDDRSLAKSLDYPTKLKDFLNF